MDFKDTLLLPKTEFPMRGNLGEKEPLLQAPWANDLLFLKRNQINKEKLDEEFCFHDGPPYANNPIHMGHALNKILKDFIVRFKQLSGYVVDFTPGWDMHGLPIENAVIKLGVNRKGDPVKFREECARFAEAQLNRQREQFLRLGCVGNFTKPYRTLASSFEAREIEAFAKMVEKGLIYRGFKPVYWSWSSESALAEAEVEYKNIESPSIFVEFKVKKTNGIRELKNASLLIWTTTPWTLPANLAICVSPHLTYSIVETNRGRLVVASDLLKSLQTKLDLGEVKVISEIKGADLQKVTYIHVLTKKEHMVILGDHVSAEDGTGLVHTAPGHGEDDFKVGQKYGLPAFSPIDSRGVLTKDAGDFVGLFFEDANVEIVKYLKESGALVGEFKITHSYPHDWRTKKPIIFRATPQWFLSIEPLKKDLFKAIDSVTWSPEWGKIRMNNMIAQRKDWCISRQRLWGVPIPVFYAEDGTAILDTKVIAHIKALFEKHGSNIWFKLPAEELLPKGFTHPKSPNGKFTKETDIMDVWFDSGTSFLSLDGRVSALYLEGSDQYRGWFNSSLINSVALTKSAPYKQVISHGFVLDEKGFKMSKSAGNGVDPNTVAKTLGADVLRIWAASVDYSQDVRVSQNLLKIAAETYRKIRNTIRYLLSNLSDFDKTNYYAFSMRSNLSKIYTIKLNELVKEVKTQFENYNFAKALQATVLFITNDLSAFYLDVTKDTLYIEPRHSYTREEVQSTYFDILTKLLVLLNPIIPHTTQEAWQTLTGDPDSQIYLEKSFPRVGNFVEFSDLLTDFTQFTEVRQTVLKTLEEMRASGEIGKSLHAVLNLTLTDSQLTAFKNLAFDLPSVLQVAKVNLNFGKEFKVSATVSKDKSCLRCWNVRPDLSTDGLCQRCQEIIAKEYPNA